jgi:hypothetical protein
MTTQSATILERFVHERMAESGNSWNVISKLDDSIIISRKKGVSHFRHFILSVLTGGLWIIVWLILAIVRKDERRTVHLTDDGNSVEMSSKGAFGGSSQRWSVERSASGSISFSRKWF